MIQINVGDRVWAGPITVDEVGLVSDDDAAGVTPSGAAVYVPDPPECGPWHPALPAVAQWLAEHPRGGETLRELAYIVGIAAEVCGWTDVRVPKPLLVAVRERFTDQRYQEFRSLIDALAAHDAEADRPL